MKPGNEKMTGTERQDLRDFLRGKGISNNEISHFIRDVSFSRKQVANELITWLKNRPKRNR